jgi:hypothetical protein
MGLIVGISCSPLPDVCDENNVVISKDAVINYRIDYANSGTGSATGVEIFNPTTSKPSFLDVIAG